MGRLKKSQSEREQLIKSLETTRIDICLTVEEFLALNSIIQDAPELQLPEHTDRQYVQQKMDIYWQELGDKYSFYWETANTPLIPKGDPRWISVIPLLANISDMKKISIGDRVTVLVNTRFKDKIKHNGMCGVVTSANYLKEFYEIDFQNKQSENIHYSCLIMGNPYNLEPAEQLT